MQPVAPTILPAEPRLQRRIPFVIWIRVVLLSGFTVLILAALAGKTIPAGWNLLSLACHQRPDRSFFLHSHQLGVCCRCIGIYFGFWQISWIALLQIDPRKRPSVRDLRLGLLFLIPMAADLTAKVALGFPSPGLLRFGVGLAYGAGLGLLAQTLANVFNCLPIQRKEPMPKPGRATEGD